MKKQSKVLVALLCAAMLVVGSVLGTLAYFTDTESATNTFTVGKVELTLDEADTDDSTAGKERDQANEYHLIPGQEYAKDPTVHVTAGSENCYVFVTVKNEIAKLEDSANTIATQMAAKGWSIMKKDGTDVTYNGLPVYVHRGNDTSATPKANLIVKSENQTDLIVFEKFKIDGSKVINRDGATGTAPDGKVYIDDYKTEGENNVIAVTAYAVQADGFDTALDAWESTFGKA